MRTWLFSCLDFACYVMLPLVDVHVVLSLVGGFFSVAKLHIWLRVVGSVY